jgi:hypothetical protein
MQMQRNTGMTDVSDQQWPNTINFILNHVVQIEEAWLVHKKEFYWKRIKEAIEIGLNENFNRDDGLQPTDEQHMETSARNIGEREKTSFQEHGKHSSIKTHQWRQKRLILPITTGFALHVCFRTFR